VTRVRLLLAILALALGIAAAVVKTPAPGGHSVVRPALYKPASGC
jgi:hypothetical protein